FTEQVRMPLIMRRGIERLSGGMFVPSIAARLLRAGVEAMAGQFIAGRDAADAAASLRSLWNSGFAWSVDLLGEVVVSEEEALAYRERYIELLDYLHSKAGGWHEDPLLERDDKGPLPHCDVSIKISSLYSRLDPMDWDVSIKKTTESLRPILMKAKEVGASVCFDMEHYYYKDFIIEVFRSVLEDFRDYPYAGIALQAYLKDTDEDLQRIIEWARSKGRRINIRLVKGAYWDYETSVNRQKGWPVPVFLNKEETDLNFEELTKVLLENIDSVRPAIATHNVRSLSNAVAAAESLGVGKESLEFQMLYGMGEVVRRSLRGMGYRVRVYTPVGDLIPGMAYLVRRLLENTSNESFLRQFFGEKKPFEELIKPPERKLTVTEESKPTDKFRNEPPIDFSRAINRRKMVDALKVAKSAFNSQYPVIINGKEILTEGEIISVNPAAHGEIIGMVSVATKKEAEMAVVTAVRTWDKWKRVSPKERAEYLFRAAAEIRDRRFELAALEVYEAGKTWKDADGDVAEAIDYFEYYGREMIRLGKTERLGDYPGEENEYFYEPKGVGVVISPWNFPLAIPAGMISATVVTGNCVIFKPSGLTPVAGAKLCGIFRKAGLPPGVLQFLPGNGGDIGEYLVSHPKVDFVAFTGSKDVGLRIVKLAGETRPEQKNVKRVITEMGGKNAVIIDETADLDEAVNGVLESSVGYQGQKCSACSRVIVVGGVFEEFIGRLKGAMASIKIGPPEDPGVFMGPMIDGKAFKRIMEYREEGEKQGTVLFVRPPEHAGYFVGPMILGDIDPSSRVAQEEIFGPVLVVMKAKNIDDAIDLANNTSYALTGGIFTRSPASIRKAKDGFRAGNLYINRKITGAIVGRQPFGGYGMSGVGSKAGGPDYLLQFMNQKSISENTLRKGFEYSVIPERESDAKG
ncbi:MAG TPA: L-glutamate gamma-semialdehyde dehydrogenase, partial [Thermodesulfovibrionales bacterium]|nr:L-glutamate gamma-semialdehyde dehydrogenase [Thermodesulfovibrionales bacterium]